MPVLGCKFFTVTYRCTLTKQAVGHFILISLWTLLINLASNDISNAEDKNISVLKVIVAYIPLSITTLIACCVVKHFFLERLDVLPDTILYAEDTRHHRVDIRSETTVQHTNESLDHRQDKGRLDPEDTRSYLDEQETGLADPSASRVRLLSFTDRSGSASFPGREVSVSMSCWTYCMELRTSSARAQLVSDDKARTVHAVPVWRQCVPIRPGSKVLRRRGSKP